MKQHCANLSDEERQCWSEDVQLFHYFGERELYGNGDSKNNGPYWVLVPLCVKHSRGMTPHVFEKK